MIAVAIDGPGGAGKSTIAKAAAKQMQFIYIDTGALYRSIGWYVTDCGKDPKNSDDVLQLLDKIKIDIRFIDGAQHVFVNEVDVSDKIRTPEISMAASSVSAMPPVRAFLLDLQRSFAKKNNVIMDGRDIGTVVLPNAKLKIFLTASAECRAKRRYDELINKGEDVKFDDVLSDLKHRDYNDSHRDIAPLKQADDAVLLDTSEMTLEQSIDAVIALIKKANDDNAPTDGDKSADNGNMTLKNEDSGLNFKIKTGINKLAAVLKVILWPIYRLLFWYSVEGLENIPKTGGYIFCSNHVSALDPAMWVLVSRRRIHFMAKEELFKNKIAAAFLKSVDVFAIKRGSKDMSSINFATEIVKQGEILGIYPEGTRSKDGRPGRAKSGVAFIANATGADVIPAAVICKNCGTVKPFHRFKLVIGKPIPHEELAFDDLKKDNLKRVSGRIMSEITSLWEENQF